MKKLIVTIAVVLAFGFTMTSCKSDQKETKETEKEVIKEVKEVTTEEASEEMALAVYQCSMDCEKGKTYDKMGTCPVCKMDLKQKESEEHEHQE